MQVSVLLFALAAPLALLPAQTATSDPAGVLGKFAVARFAGSGTESIQAMTSDPDGNLYVAGTTSSPVFLVKNAAQPAIGGGLPGPGVDYLPPAGVVTRVSIELANEVGLYVK